MSSGLRSESVETERRRPGIFAAALGPAEEFTLEHRLLNTTFLTLAAVCAVGVVLNLAWGRTATVEVVAPAGVAALVFYYLARYRRYFQALLLPATLVPLAGCAAIFVLNAGTQGPVMLFLLLVALIPVTTTRGVHRAALVLLVVAVGAALFALEYARPELILPYHGRRQRYVDLGVCFALVTVVIGSFMAILARGYNDMLHRLHEEQAKSERLLDNILPQTVSARLKSQPGSIADRFEAVTVLFADIVGFTELSREVPAQNIVALLNDVFSRFDAICQRYGLEKIKTIGDAYMAVAGVPVPRPDHAQAAAEMALAMLSAVPPELEVRIGLNSGPAVAGVIGTRKLAYDLWGDTVNTASRMESHGSPARSRSARPPARRSATASCSRSAGRSRSRARARCGPGGCAPRRARRRPRRRRVEPADRADFRSVDTHTCSLSPFRQLSDNREWGLRRSPSEKEGHGMRRLAYLAVLLGLGALGLSACGDKVASGVDCTQSPDNPACTGVTAAGSTSGSSSGSSGSSTGTSASSSSSGSSTGRSSSSSSSGSSGGSSGSSCPTPVDCTLRACTGQPCSGGVCSGGECVADCSINGTDVPDDAGNPANVCQKCDLAASATTWTSLTDGFGCDAGSVCIQGACQYGCYLDGGYQPSGASNGCAQCDPLTSTTSWTPWDEGQSLPCPGGAEVCHQGACTPGCYINSGFVVPDAGNPANACESCQPATDTTVYSPMVDGSVCNADAKHFCRNDTCVSGCRFPDAGVVDANAPDPTNDCYRCQPGVNATQFSPVGNGQACTSNSGSVCYNNSCQLGCYISGTFYSDGSLKPGNPCQGCYAASSISAWSNPPEGTQCNNNATGSYCHAGSCQYGCVISGTFYANGAVNSANKCQLCDPTRSATAWSAKTCGANMACSNGTCVCDANYADCDGNPSNGCEVQTTTTLNCGGCGVRCGCIDYTCGPKGLTCCPNPCLSSNGTYSCAG